MMCDQYSYLYKCRFCKTDEIIVVSDACFCALYLEWLDLETVDII